MRVALVEVQMGSCLVGRLLQSLYRMCWEFRGVLDAAACEFESKAVLGILSVRLKAGAWHFWVFLLLLRLLSLWWRGFMLCVWVCVHVQKTRRDMSPDSCLDDCQGLNLFFLTSIPAEPEQSWRLRIKHGFYVCKRDVAGPLVSCRISGSILSLSLILKMNEHLWIINKAV